MLSKFKDILEEIYDFDEEVACVDLPIEEVYQPGVEKSIEELEKQGLELIKPDYTVSISEREKSYCVEALGKKLFFPKRLYNAESIIDVLENKEFTDLIYQGNFLKKIAFCFKRKD